MPRRASNRKSTNFAERHGDCILGAGAGLKKLRVSLGSKSCCKGDELTIKVQTYVVGVGVKGD